MKYDLIRKAICKLENEGWDEEANEIKKLIELLDLDEFAKLREMELHASKMIEAGDTFYMKYFK